MTEFQPRLNQRAVLAYTGGRMGVAAVPGSGKTWTLSLLAARLIAEGNLGDDQEVLIVTLVNSAVSNFAGRVARFVQERGLLPHVGYRVRTLHGLAHDIVRERPALAGLADDFQIIDERAAQEILEDAAQAWVRQHPNSLDAILAADVDETRAAWVRRESWPAYVIRLATSFIKQTKDLQLTPADLRYRLDRFSEPLPLLEMGCAIYADYQRALAYRGGVDFDDLIRLALRTLNLDPAFLARLRERWPYILEDEAQDSSSLQEKILALLAGPEGNWVRVGDPNQAIYETFTTASPEYLRKFMKQPGVQPRDLPNSGRSTQSIINLANYLIRWCNEAHPIQKVRNALDEPYIKPTPPGDPQPNPPDAPEHVHFVTRSLSPQQEIDLVVRSLERWLPEHKDETVAVLVPRNERGFEVTNALKTKNIPCIELLRSTRSTREAAGALTHLGIYLAEPASAKKLATVYRVWQRQSRDDPAAEARVAEVARLLRQIARVEDYLWPRADRDWLAEQNFEATDPLLYEHLVEFRTLVRRWQGTTTLPIDQLILTLAQDLFSAPTDLAIAHKLAVVLRQHADAHPEWRLPELTQELAVIAKNERKFLGFTDEDTGFDPDKHKGEVVVSTIHKAKGLEWDKVYLLSVNDYDFPSALPQDSFISEAWFARDHLNLEAEVLAQLKALCENPDVFIYDEGEATLKARRDYAAERLRLLYVGITRARKALTVTWNTGRRGTAQPAVPFIALQTWWEEQKSQRD
ncbi:MAG TPA: ATP-dependent helicase [Anaerolineae bacterium]|nr:ATP-dependent helicase [Anaerolineae bacterium]HQK14818.1 ATP-dependent helicase [Anaerolineae bacterium]